MFRQALAVRKLITCSKKWILLSRTRYYSIRAPAENITVPCQSNGSITLDLYYPRKESAERNQSPLVLLYLPRGPQPEDAARDASTIDVLRSNLECPIVQVNYRLDSEHRYPNPVHDVLAGYDWILEHLLPKRAIVRAGRSESVGKVAVCGEHIGGGLATALALTECHIGQPGVVAAALSNPLVDWVSLDDQIPEPTDALNEEDSKHSELQTLSRLRTRAFAKPEKYFDPFASPVLFFRSSGAEVPPPPTEDIPLDDMAHLSKLEREEIYREELTLDSNPEEEIEEKATPVRRRASRRFPSKALGIRLPHFHISAGLESALAGQARELTHLLRQSFVRQSKNAASASSEFGRKVSLDGEEDDELNSNEKAVLEAQKLEAERSAELSLHEGSGQWDETATGRQRVTEVAQWIKSKFDT